MKIMSQETIDRLNAEAEALIKAGEGRYDSYQYVACKNELTFVMEALATQSGESPQCEVWQLHGEFVNLWIDGDYLGFDDQIGATEQAALGDWANEQNGSGF